MPANAICRTPRHYVAAGPQAKQDSEAWGRKRPGPELPGQTKNIRYIINLKAEHVDAWLTPQKHSTAELQAMLSDRAIPALQHEIVQVA